MTFPLYQVNSYEDSIHELEGVEKLGGSVIFLARDWNGKTFKQRYQLHSDYCDFFFTREEAAEFIRRRLQGQIDHHAQQAEFFRERRLVFEQSLQEVKK